jgi:hypothetical protein
MTENTGHKEIYLSVLDVHLLGQMVRLKGKKTMSAHGPDIKPRNEDQAAPTKKVSKAMSAAIVLTNSVSTSSEPHIRHTVRVRFADAKAK